MYSKGKEFSYSYGTCIRAKSLQSHNILKKAGAEFPRGITIWNVTRYTKTTSRHQAQDHLEYGPMTDNDIVLDNVPKGTNGFGLIALAQQFFIDLSELS